MSDDDDQQLEEEAIFRRAKNRGFVGFAKDDNAAWRGPFRFIQAADPQFGLIDEFKHVNWDGLRELAIVESAKYKARAKSVWDEEMRLCNRAIGQWNEMVPRPRFVVICGDLVNDYPGGMQRAEQLVDFKIIFGKLNQDIPLVLLPGNHDLLNQPTVAAVEDYRREFGDDYFSFVVDGVMFMVINVQYFKNKTDVEALAGEHERWIDERLQEVTTERYKHIIVFQHIPWFLRDVDEPDDDMYTIAINERKRMIEKFSKAGVRAIFAGHYHRNAGGHYEDLEMVVTSAMGAQNTGGGLAADRSGYRVVEVTEEAVEHHYVEIEKQT